jgi:hypothetical protein
VLPKAPGSRLNEDNKASIDAPGSPSRTRKPVVRALNSKVVASRKGRTSVELHGAFGEDNPFLADITSKVQAVTIAEEPETQAILQQEATAVDHVFHRESGQTSEVPVIMRTPPQTSEDKAKVRHGSHNEEFVEYINKGFAEDVGQASEADLQRNIAALQLERQELEGSNVSGSNDQLIAEVDVEVQLLTEKLRVLQQQPKRASELPEAGRSPRPNARVSRDGGAGKRIKPTPPVRSDKRASIVASSESADGSAVVGVQHVPEPTPSRPVEAHPPNPEELLRQSAALEEQLRSSAPGAASTFATLTIQRGKRSSRTSGASPQPNSPITRMPSNPSVLGTSSSPVVIDLRSIKQPSMIDVVVDAQAPSELLSETSSQGRAKRTAAEVAADIARVEAELAASLAQEAAKVERELAHALMEEVVYVERELAIAIEEEKRASLGDQHDEASADVEYI